MNAELQQDIAALADTVRRFTLERIAQQVAQWDEAGEFPRVLYRKAAEIGLLGHMERAAVREAENADDFLRRA